MMMKDEIKNDLMERYRWAAILGDMAKKTCDDDRGLSGLNMRLVTVYFGNENDEELNGTIEVRYVVKEDEEKVEMFYGNTKGTIILDDEVTIDVALSRCAEILEEVTESIAADEEIIIRWNWLGD